jgi:hypothetical protein
MPERPCATHIRVEPKIEGAKPERELPIMRLGWHGTMQVAVRPTFLRSRQLSLRKVNARGLVSC